METGNTNTNFSWKDGYKGYKTWKIIAIIILIILILKSVGGGYGWNDDRIINTISVSGKGEVIVKPDIATISFGVTAENLDVAKAQTESANKINKILSSLKEKGVDEKDVKTTNYNIYPRYDYLQTAIYPPYGGKQVLSAYVVSQNVEVKIRDISKAGEILSSLGEFGATDISGLNFSVDKIDEERNKARDLAIEDAKAQAKVLARGLDVRLVRITNFSEGGNSPMPMYYGVEKTMNMAMGGDMVAPQLPAGENKIVSQVTITYEIK